MAKSIRKSMFATDVGEALVIPGYEPYEIPKNWCWVYLGAINQFVGHSINPLLEAQNIYELYSVPSSENNYPEIVAGSEIGSSKQSVEKDDVLLCKINPRINRVWMVSKYTVNTLIASSEWIVVRNSMICSKYLMWCMRSPYFREYMLSNVSGVGGSLMRAKPEHVKKYPIALAPLAEQHRIVEKIESLFSKLDDAKEKAQEVLDNFENRKASILHKAFSGELTAKWRKENELDVKSWKYISLDTLSEKIFDGPFGSNLKSEDYVDSGIRVVRLENLKNLWFDDSKQSFVTKEKYETIKRHTVYPSDLIMSTFIADEIKVCQMPSYVKFAVNKADCIGIRLKGCVNKKYVLYYLSSKIVFNLLINQIHGATRPRVNTKQIKSINIFMPTIEEQDEIVEFLDKFINDENESKKTAEKVIDQIDVIKKSILARAFRGKLGTNDSNDENAEELLKEILIEKAAEKENQHKITKKRITIPKEIENLIGTNLEQKIVKLFFESETREVSVEDILSVSSKTFDILETIRNLEKKDLIKKQKNDKYRIMY